MKLPSVLLALILALTSVESSLAQCPSWDAGFAAPQNGLGNTANAIGVFDLGSGPELYVGGTFPTAGSLQIPFLARRAGTSWAALGSPGVDHFIYALEQYDDGSGSQLYAAGHLRTAGGIPAGSIARWDGASWSALGPPGSGFFGEWVEAYSLAVHDDGTGPALYVGGYFGFTSTGQIPGIWRWNGSWSIVGPPPGAPGHFAGSPRALVSFDDGSGPALYAGAGTTTGNVHRWDGTSWTSMGTDMGTATFPGTVRALEVFDDGSGPALYAGGHAFTTPLGQGAITVAKWNGVVWSPVGPLGSPSSYGSTVLALRGYDDGTGPALYAGGTFTSIAGMPASRIAKWDGVSWSAVGAPVQGTSNDVLALDVFDDGSGAKLYVGGGFGTAGGVSATCLATWDGTSWSEVGGPTGHGLDGEVHGISVFDDGSGEALYAGGNFLKRIVRWTGTSWAPVQPWSPYSVIYDVMALVTVGNELYVGGNFEPDSWGTQAYNVVRLNGSTWSALGAPGSGTDGPVRALAGHDDGSGSAVYVGGSFFHAGGIATMGVARFDGASWSDVGGGTDGFVQALVEYDDGSGSVLVAGGEFSTAGGVLVNSIARWNGTGWTPLGGGVNGVVRALIVFDDGTGPALYAGGTFSHAGGVSARHLARWNGTSWSPLDSSGGTDGTVDAFTIHDDGSGPALYVGGTFMTVGGIAANRLARWDGASWSAVGAPGIDGTQGAIGVRALISFEDGSDGAPDLFVGGRFSAAGGVPSAHVARWNGCAANVDAFCFGDGSAAPCPCSNSGLANHGCENSSGTGGALLSSSGSTALDTLVLAQSGQPSSSLSIFLQGSAETAVPIVFGDGLRCATGTLKRLYVQNASAGSVSAPAPGEPSIRELSAILGDPLVPGSVRVYQVRYRDPVLGFCPPPQGSSFNVGNALRVTW